MPVRRRRILKSCFHSDSSPAFKRILWKLILLATRPLASFSRVLLLRQGWTVSSTNRPTKNAHCWLNLHKRAEKRQSSSLNQFACALVQIFEETQDLRAMCAAFSGNVDSGCSLTVPAGALAAAVLFLSTKKANAFRPMPILEPEEIRVIKPN